jgi:SAM-dependent methyltransferase
MKKTVLATLSDYEEFRARREAAWVSNANYWLEGNLRHVQDVGDRILCRTIEFCRQSPNSSPLVVDMGCGDAWLLRDLLKSKFKFSYLGLDYTPQFISSASEEFDCFPNVSFERVDLESECAISASADVVVNAFNFFELCDLEQGFKNAAKLLGPKGTLLMSTIDKTYLMIALSQGWEDFHAILRDYAVLPGVKYAFQAIDLGDRASDILVYPSVLYTTEDYIRAASSCGLKLTRYYEDVFTNKPIPKIYCHLEFSK